MPKKGETVWQKEKKNKSRILAKERGLYPTTQKKSYAKPKVEVEENNKNQIKFLW